MKGENADKSAHISVPKAHDVNFGWSKIPETGNFVKKDEELTGVEKINKRDCFVVKAAITNRDNNEKINSFM